jgi:hypothetical protein
LKRSHDEKFSLSIQERKGKFRNIANGESTTQYGKRKKDIIKFKFFACHKFGHYAGKCLHMKKGGNVMHLEVARLENTQLDGFYKNIQWT